MRKFLVVLLVCIAFVTTSHAGEAKGLFTADDKPEMWCLALNVYFEARSSNRADRMAVADVVINRARDTRYPNTLCGVVQQGK